jgi:hypothetical protein
MGLVTTLALTVGFLSACSQNGGSIDPSYGLNLGAGLEQNSGGSSPVIVSPPAGFDYYQLYSSVTAVNVEIKQVFVRTQDGRVLEVPLSSSTILDLMQMGTTQGVSVNLPGTGQETVVEVIVRLKDNGRNEVVFSDGRTCKLKTRGEITLFARNALVLDRGVPYRVHGSFDPLEALTLNCTESNAHVHAATNSNDDHGSCNNGDEQSCRLRCSLANSRFEISGVEFDPGA